MPRRQPRLVSTVAGDRASRCAHEMSVVASTWPVGPVIRASGRADAPAPRHATSTVSTDTGLAAAAVCRPIAFQAVPAGAMWLSAPSSKVRIAQPISAAKDEAVCQMAGSRSNRVSGGVARAGRLVICLPRVGLNSVMNDRPVGAHGLSADRTG
jgi:hypothetical protein